MYEKLIIGVDGREGGLDAATLAALLAAPAARRYLVFVAGAPAHTGRGAVGTCTSSWPIPTALTS